MILLTVQFDPGRSTNYQRLLEVFKISVEKNMPDVEFVNIRIDAPDRKISVARNLTYNTEKLRIWTNFIDSHPNENIILADCDMLCVKDPSRIFLKNFDIGITFKSCEIKKSPMNGGIVFIKNNPKAREFMHLWRDINNQMYQDRLFHNQWRGKYLGMNQAAFGYIYEILKPDCNLLEVPTLKYNAVDCDWKSVNDETCFIHIKSELRRAVITNIEPSGDMNRCMTEWYKYQEMIPKPAPEIAQAIKQPKLKRKKMRYRKLKRRGRMV